MRKLLILLAGFLMGCRPEVDTKFGQTTRGQETGRADAKYQQTIEASNSYPFRLASASSLPTHEPATVHLNAQERLGTQAVLTSESEILALRESAVRGDRDSQYKLGRYLESRSPDLADQGQAIRFYVEAAAQGHTTALDHLRKIAAAPKNNGQEYAELQGSAKNRHLVARAYREGYSTADLGFAEAIRIAMAAVNADPEPGALYALYYLLDGAERWSEALEVLERAAEMAPSNARIQRNLVTSYLGQKRTNDAMEAALRTVAIAPNVDHSWFGLAAVYRGLQWAKAEELVNDLALKASISLSKLPKTKSWWLEE